MDEQKKAEAAELRVNEKKWTPTLMKAGWTAIPTVIIERQQALGLDQLDVNILLHLCSFWWSKDSKPMPSKVTIAKAIGVDPRTVQRRIAAMERDGLIRREQRRISKVGSKPNVYHLNGLIEAAKPFAEEKIKIRAAEAAVRKARAVRKKPTLRLIKSEEE
jgi:predicted transcriptional regulator